VSPAPGSTDPCILVVEDNPANMMLVRALLARLSCRLVEATSGAQALAEVETQPPDLILMDLQLPDIDGLSLTRQLKEAEGTRHIPIIALTAHAMAGDEETARAAGCDGYLTKPLDTRSFCPYVERYLINAGGGE
jgi:CheY-like chemotaxis protein